MGETMGRVEEKSGAYSVKSIGAIAASLYLQIIWMIEKHCRVYDFSIAIASTYAMELFMRFPIISLYRRPIGRLGVFLFNTLSINDTSYT